MSWRGHVHHQTISIDGANWSIDGANWSRKISFWVVNYWDNLQIIRLCLIEFFSLLYYTRLLLIFDNWKKTEINSRNIFIETRTLTLTIINTKTLLLNQKPIDNWNSLINWWFFLLLNCYSQGNFKDGDT